MRLFLTVAFGVFAAVTGASFLGRAHWLFDLVANFRPQLAMAGLGLAMVALLARRRTIAVMAAATFIGYAIPLVPYVMPLIARATAEGPGLRVLTLNLHGEAADENAVVRLIVDQQVDVVLLTEIATSHRPLLAALADRLPYSVVGRLGSPFELALLSRWPLSQVRVDRSVHDVLPVLEATLCGVGGPDEAGCIALVGLHALAPLVERAEPRNAQLALAAARVRAQGHDRVILLGDLNLTPWSPYFTDLLATAALADSGRGHGLTGTWRSRSPLFGLPIDHVLIGRGLAVRSRQVGPDIGSDHYPLLVDLALREARTGRK